ncbi:hypothetical protein NHX12_025681 [Muraenolepis orangiensis]|uniref:Calponin-homology (CH) domain-containing protein n=1 Tax=Muraenolepis orangiensis TaxID=630683 RepID=A0A9Q0IQ29_9TELE|nr:hypothetical protein NHX12_025681 [Muraenolepis orangiensis]
MEAAMEADGGHRPTGQTPDQKSPEGEKTAVQKQTFTRWMNVFLKRCDPPVEVQDLFLDVRDGKALMVLLEELSGCKLVYRFRPSSHRIFRLNNIAKALAFLDDRHVKLLGIDASSVADGVPHVVLQLMWNIISFFQIKEATRGLQRRLSSSLSSLSSSGDPASCDLSPSPGSFSSCTLPAKRRRPAREPRLRWRPMKALLRWVQSRTSRWRSGVAFLALIKSIDPGLVDLRGRLSREPQHNLEEAFRIAQDSLGIPALLEPQDVVCTSPDERSVVTYLSMFLEYHSDQDSALDIRLGPQVTEIQDYTPAEPGGYGGTPARQLEEEEEEEEAFSQSQIQTTEQLLWKRWSRRSSGEAFSPQSGMKPTLAARDAGVLSWMEEASEDHHVFRSSYVDRRVSQSSEDGRCRLDSDEEDAYSYILDLHRDTAHGHRALPGSPEGTAHGGWSRTPERRPKWGPKPLSPSSPALRNHGSDRRPARSLQNGIAEKRTEGRTQTEPGVADGRANRSWWPDTEDGRSEGTDGAASEREGGAAMDQQVEKLDHGEDKDEQGAEPRGERQTDVRLARPKWSKVNTLERPTEDSVFRDGSVVVTEETSGFRGRFGYGPTSSTASQPSPGRLSGESHGGDETAGIWKDSGPLKHAEGEIQARVDHESIHAKPPGSQTLDCRAAYVPEVREKGAAASSCDVTGLERDVLFGLWMFLFCYFLCVQIHL